ncbi:hypothetical protein ACTG22_04340 [Aeromonas caviae]|uniref:hypothetical protein n=1 Tax=Aeromonas caviae TaxID=648 RepID=UPI00309A97B4
MSHPASLASRLHALALNDTLFPDLHQLEKAQRTRAIYRIFHTVASTAALGQEDIVDDLAPLLTLMESPCLTRQGGLCPLLASHYNLYLGTLLDWGIGTIRRSSARLRRLWPCALTGSIWPPSSVVATMP